MSFKPRMVGLQISVAPKAKETLDRQARERGVSTALWASQLFGAGFAAVCAREKSMPITDDDLDAILGATLLLRAREKWDTATIAQSLGVSEPTVVRMLDTWRTYRAGSEAPKSEPAPAVKESSAKMILEEMAMDDLLDLKMRKKFRIILEILVNNPRAFVPTERFTSKLWEDDPNGGPDDALSLVYNHISLLRRDVLNPVGWTIAVSRGDGYRLERLLPNE